MKLALIRVRCCQRVPRWQVRVSFDHRSVCFRGPSQRFHVLFVYLHIQPSALPCSGLNQGRGWGLTHPRYISLPPVSAGLQLDKVNERYWQEVGGLQEGESKGGCPPLSSRCVSISSCTMSLALAGPRCPRVLASSC